MFVASNKLNKEEIDGYLIMKCLSSKLVFAAKLMTTSTSLNISSNKKESFTPKFWEVISPPTTFTLSEMKESKFPPCFSFRTLNKSFEII